MCSTRFVLFPLSVAVCLLATGEALAQEHPSCDALRAQADSQSALLFSPSATLQVVRVPGGTDLSGSGDLLGSDTQVRAGLAFSPVDVYRGSLVQHRARQACSRIRALESIEPALQQAGAYGRAGALRAQTAYLDAARTELDELLRDAEARLERRVATVLEVGDIRRRRLRLLRQQIEARQELAALEQNGMDELLDTSIDAAVDEYGDASLAAYGAESRLRKADAWQVQLRGGVVPGADVDWYGVVSVGYRFGGLWQGGAEDRYLSARRAELTGSNRELRRRAESFAAAMADSARLLREELALVDSELELIAQEVERVEASATARSRQLLTVLALDRIELSARRAFVVALIEARAAVRTEAQ